MFAVMKNWDLMIGVDPHICWPPGAPLPLPNPVPYVTVMVLNGLQPLTPMLAPTSQTFYGLTVQRGSDIGPGIPHIGPPSILTPLDVLFSSSVSYFGASAYTHEGQPCAAALLVAVGLNANCQEPVSLPTGLVLCVTTHFTWMSPFDIMFGFACMIFDAALEFAGQNASNWASGFVTRNVMNPIASRITAKMASRTAGKSAAKTAGKTAGKTAAKTTATAQAWQKARPSGAPGKTTPTAGGHRRPAPPAGPPKKKEILLAMVKDIFFDLGMAAPMSLVHMLGMEMLELTGIEEFGAPREEPQS
ncbi:hypothetical protein [Nannocystis punicea]|uniref:Uncharacterized protein n=1 Tax=Nannocystis punicea TaxID=2995304 RepID=A0ABY7H5K0_9BACT|nr:hypothetical protein [Nannocystis poenicansa]WAS94541.1 hypothetical protein O0S08_00140 [Nannocystis poenicansa]